jgi:hypothetical protein
MDTDERMQFIKEKKSDLSILQDQLELLKEFENEEEVDFGILDTLLDTSDKNIDVDEKTYITNKINSCNLKLKTLAKAITLCEKVSINK